MVGYRMVSQDDGRRGISTQDGLLSFWNGHESFGERLLLLFIAKFIAWRWAFTWGRWKSIWTVLCSARWRCSIGCWRCVWFHHGLSVGVNYIKVFSKAWRHYRQQVRSGRLADRSARFHVLYVFGLFELDLPFSRAYSVESWPFIGGVLGQNHSQWNFGARNSDSFFFFLARVKITDTFPRIDICNLAWYQASRAR